MANAVVVQILEEGPRNAVVKVTGVLDTSDVASSKLIDTATLNQGGTGPVPDKLRINEIQYSVSSQLQVRLDWHATTNVVIAGLSGSGEFEACEYGGINNNAGVGVDGDIDLVTYGWASGIQTFTLILHLVKQGAVL